MVADAQQLDGVDLAVAVEVQEAVRSVLDGTTMRGDLEAHL